MASTDQVVIGKPVVPGTGPTGKIKRATTVTNRDILLGIARTGMRARRVVLSRGADTKAKAVVPSRRVISRNTREMLQRLQWRKARKLSWFGGERKGIMAGRMLGLQILVLESISAGKSQACGRFGISGGPNT